MEAPTLCLAAITPCRSLPQANWCKENALSRKSEALGHWAGKSNCLYTRPFFWPGYIAKLGFRKTAKEG